MRRLWWVALRPIAWAVAWGLTIEHLLLWAGWSFWPAYLVSLLANVVAYLAARRRSLAWRLAVVLNWHKMQRPLVYNEDNVLMGGMLPFERLCVIGNDDGPIEAHVHTRTLLLGRPRLRAETVWRQP